jgi:hypothetical protein
MAVQHETAHVRVAAKSTATQRFYEPCVNPNSRGGKVPTRERDVGQHSLLWLVSTPSDAESSTWLCSPDPDTSLCITAASAWDIAIETRLGRIVVQRLGAVGRACWCGGRNGPENHHESHTCGTKEEAPRISPHNPLPTICCHVFGGPPKRSVCCRTLPGRCRVMPVWGRTQRSRRLGPALNRQPQTHCTVGVSDSCHI